MMACAASLVHLEINLLFRVVRTLLDTETDFVGARSELVGRQIRDIRNATVLSHRRQGRFRRAQVLPIPIETHREVRSILHGGIGIHSEVERKNASRPSLQRSAQSRGDLST